IISRANPKVDIFIAVYKEPFNIVAKTVKAACNIKYQHKSIFILDDGGSERLRSLAKAVNCNYLYRDSACNNKAGNLNFGLINSKAELIMTLDADRLCHPDIINKMAGYFSLPHIGFVQAAPDFDVRKGDPYGNKEEVLYKAVLPGKDNDNAAFLYGFAVMYRRRALEEIGGFSTWNIMTDMHTALRLQEKGWRSVYYNYPLSSGLAPENIQGYYRLKRQLCADSVRMLFWDSPLFKKKLSLKQKLQYFHAGFSFLVSAFVMPVFYFVPIWSLFTGDFIVSEPVSNYAFFRAPLLGLTYIAGFISSYPQNINKTSQMWSGAFPAYIYGAIFGLFSKKQTIFCALPSTGKTRIKSIALLAVLPQITIIALILFALVYAVLNNTNTPVLLITNIFWTVLVIWLLSRICYAAFIKNKPVAVS
ncbi:MAG: glycosyltransferase, partial [Candidatus Omnitrophica bacterium]|nr:glycosyltransferase [Candidatus Omnitrophota bacterium]